MTAFVHLNGHLLPEAQARISPFDRGFLLGDGVFETLRVDRGNPRHLPEHLARLRGSAEATRIPLPDVDLERIIREVVDANSLSGDAARVRITLTRGPGLPGPSPASAHGSPTLLVTASPLRVDPRVYTEGVHVILAATRRVPASALPPHVKSTSYLPLILARAEAEARGAFEALVLDAAGERVVEATAANVFLVLNGEIVTPDLGSGCLPGVTRQSVLDLARTQGLRADERPVSPGELSQAEEVFLTSSGLGIVPVARVDDAVVGPGRPGPVATVLHRKLEEAS